MGPTRQRQTALISLVVGVALALLFLLAGLWWVTFIVGMGALQSYQRYQAESSRARTSGPARRRPAPSAPDEPIPPEVTAQLAMARAALADDDYDRAGTIAESVLSDQVPANARLDALHIIAWAHLLLDRHDEAARVAAVIERHGTVDLALTGAILHARGDLSRAREALESARTQGDERKEVLGPLIQILIAQGEVARATSIALDIVDSLSEDDARQMAAIALEAGIYDGSSRLSESVFERSGRPEDAYDAARARAMGGDETAAVALLRRAVAAGFSDAARAWSDAALEPLRAGGELDTLLPRPSGAENGAA